MACQGTDAEGPRAARRPSNSVSAGCRGLRQMPSPWPAGRPHGFSGALRPCTGRMPGCFRPGLALCVFVRWVSGCSWCSRWPRMVRFGPRHWIMAGHRAVAGLGRCTRRSDGLVCGGSAKAGGNCASERNPKSASFMRHTPRRGGADRFFGFVEAHRVANQLGIFVLSPCCSCNVAEDSGVCLLPHDVAALQSASSWQRRS